MHWLRTRCARALRALAPAATACATSALLACTPDAQVYHVDGTVESIDVAEGQLYVAHDVIPGFMPAMTMNFDVASPVLLEDLEPGDAIHFTLERTPDSLQILTIEKSAGVAGSSGGAAASGTAQAAPDVAPDFELLDQDGRPFRSQDLRGSAVVLDFIFTRCEGPCPILTARHAALQRDLPEALRGCTRFVSISVDPEHDRPEVLRRYADQHRADLDDWSFLTGPPERVRHVLRLHGVAAGPAADGSIAHTVATFLIDPEGRIARRYLGVSAAGAQLESDLAEVCS